MLNQLQWTKVGVGLAFLFFSSNLIAGGAWVKEFNRFYSEVNFGYASSDKIFNSTGKKIDIGLLKNPAFPGSVFLGTIDSTYKQYDTNLYIEYGLGFDLELMLNLPMFVVAQQTTVDGNYTAEGMGDGLFGLKYKWLDKPWLVSAVSVESSLLFGNENEEGTLTGKVNQPIPLGDGEWDVAARLFLSKGFYPLPLYLSGDFGYRVRTTGNIDYFNDYPWSFEVGYTQTLRKEKNALKNVTLSAGIRGLISSKDQITDANLGGLAATGVAPGQEFGNVYGGLFLNLYKGLALVSSVSYSLYGKNTGAGYAFRTGLAYSR